MAGGIWIVLSTLYNQVWETPELWALYALKWE